MVTKAIERAQNTVEARNAEIRKNVLKYDEVMNEQRKVDLPAPRPDPRGRRPARPRRSRSSPRPSSRSSPPTCVSEYREEGTSRAPTEIRTFWPTRLTAEELQGTRRPTSSTSC